MVRATVTVSVLVVLVRTVLCCESRTLITRRIRCPLVLLALIMVRPTLPVVHLVSGRLWVIMVMTVVLCVRFSPSIELVPPCVVKMCLTVILLGCYLLMTVMRLLRTRPSCLVKSLPLSRLSARRRMRWVRLSVLVLMTLILACRDLGLTLRTCVGWVVSMCRCLWVGWCRSVFVVCCLRF